MVLDDCGMKAYETILLVKSCNSKLVIFTIASTSFNFFVSDYLIIRTSENA